MNEVNLISGPHTHAYGGVGRIMGTVMLALAPATVFAIYLFGWPALNLLILTILSALVSEAASLWLAGKPLRPFLFDGSALLTGWLLAMTLPPWAPWWIAVLGGGFAMVIGKHVFGGIGQNVFNPAMLARVALLISFPLEMTTWVAPVPLASSGAPNFLEGLRITFLGIPDIDALSGASILGHVKTTFTQGKALSEALIDQYANPSLTLGFIRGSLGETSALLLFLGGLFLWANRTISWYVPIAMLASVALLATSFHILNPEHYANAKFHLLSGGMMLGAFFIATDPATSPSTRNGQLLFGAGCGAVVYVIRTWGGYPEGVAFAVLLMNAATPLIDHYLRPRIYGRRRDGASLQYPPEKLATKKNGRRKS